MNLKIIGCVSEGGITNYASSIYDKFLKAGFAATSRPAICLIIYVQNVKEAIDTQMKHLENNNV